MFFGVEFVFVVELVFGVEFVLGIELMLAVGAGLNKLAATLFLESLEILIVLATGVDSPLVLTVVEGVLFSIEVLASRHVAAIDRFGVSMFCLGNFLSRNKLPVDMVSSSSSDVERSLNRPNWMVWKYEKQIMRNKIHKVRDKKNQFKIHSFS